MGLYITPFQCFKHSDFPVFYNHYSFPWVSSHRTTLVKKRQRSEVSPRDQSPRSGTCDNTCVGQYGFMPGKWLSQASLTDGAGFTTFLSVKGKESSTHSGHSTGPKHFFISDVIPPKYSYLKEASTKQGSSREHNTVPFTSSWWT